MKIEEVTLNLEEDLLDFSNLFLKFRLQIDSSVDTLQESVLLKKLTKESQSLLLGMKECQIRVDKDISTLENILEKKQQYGKGTWFRSNRNIIDAFQTCESIFAEYNKFLRKDISLLKETFEKLEKSIKKLNELIKGYNKTTQLKIEEISEKYETLHKVVVLGFEITKPTLISFEEFQKLYPEADLAFLRYLKGINADCNNKKEEWKWLNDLEKYFDTFDVGDFTDVVYQNTKFVREETKSR